jgi:hypothetical protein
VLGKQEDLASNAVACAGERASIDDADKGFHRGKAVHRLFPLGMDDITTTRVAQVAGNERGITCPIACPVPLHVVEGAA